jgi:nicotinate dehydrogenase subunit B
MGQLEFVVADTNVTPNTGKHSASNTIKNAGPGVRAAAASARQVLLGLAAAQLGVPVSQLAVSKGVVSGGGKSVTYGELLGGKLFSTTMPASYGLQNASGGSRFAGGLQAGQSPAKPVSQYKLVGTRPPEVDIPKIVTGTFTFIQNVRVPGMLHGRVVRPRGQAVYGFGAPIVSVDESSISNIAGARVVRKNDFLGVVAQHEYDAIQAAAQLKVKWADPPKALPGNGNEFKGMRALDSAGKTVWSSVDLQHDAPNNGDVDKALASAAHVVAQTYGWPTNIPNVIGPGCTIADVTPQGARILSGTQGAYSTRQQVAAVTGLPLDKVRVTVFPMGGCNGPATQYQDAAQAAALMSQLAGAPVRVQFMRWDEISWSATGPGTLMDVRAGIDGNGNIVGFDYTHFYPQYKQGAVETNDELTGTPIPAVASSISGQYWPGPMYNVANNRYLLKSIPLEGNWIKAAWMRAGTSPHATFAGEQVVDELAHAANMDPVAFRVQNVTQDETQGPLLTVLDTVTKAANWQPRVAASKLSDANIVTGRGIAWSSVYSPDIPVAAIADVTVNKKTGKITVNHIYQAFSAGLVINPGLVENQVVGGIMQITSRLLVEEFRYSRTNVTSTDFVSYPIMRFKDSPKVTAIVVQQSGLPPRGVGEPVTVAAPAAIANAFFDATGVRMRTAPMTPARVRATLQAAGVA